MPVSFGSVSIRMVFLLFLDHIFQFLIIQYYSFNTGYYAGYIDEDMDFLSSFNKYYWAFF
jgi:hypothetical protein